MSASARFPLWLMIAACLLLGGAFYYYYVTYLRDKYDWRDSWPREAYGEKDIQPYGSQIFHHLLSGYFSSKGLTDIKKKVSTELPLDSSQHLNYVFVGEGMLMDSTEAQHLLRFVGIGNTALLISKCVPFEVMQRVYALGCADAEWENYPALHDSIVRVTIPLPEGKQVGTALHYALANRPVSYDWQYLPGHYFCAELPHRPIGHLRDSLVNFALFRYGKGTLLLHCNPLAFSNYSLLRPDTRPYAEAVLGWLPEGPVYWDVVSRVPELVARRANSKYDFSQEAHNDHLLTFVLKQPALAWAWYILVGLTGLWFIFKAKRRQRIIPVMRRNENSSYEFISTIAHLHFRERNYDGISIQKMKLFLAQLRDRYGLSANLNPVTHALRTDDDFFKKLATVSQVAEADIHDIFRQYAACAQYQTNQTMMTELHLAIEAFWKKAR